MKEIEHIIKNSFIYHVANPVNRKSILKDGLQPRPSTQRCGHYNEEALMLFCTDAKDHISGLVFESTWDDDIWKIETKELTIKWWKDLNFYQHKHIEDNDHHIYTCQIILPKYLTLIKEGSGASTF